MKLIKKLLPVATLGSVAAVVLPLSTSCTTGSSNSSFDLDKLFDTSDWLQSETESCRLSQAVSEYAEVANDDNEIFLKDVRYGSVMNYQRYLSEMLSYTQLANANLQTNNCSASISNVSFGENSGHESVSFVFNAKIDATASMIATSTSTPAINCVHTAEIIADVSNVPFLFAASSLGGLDFALPLYGKYYDGELLGSLTDDWYAKIGFSYHVNYFQQGTAKKPSINKTYEASSSIRMNNDKYVEPAETELIPDFNEMKPYPVILYTVANFLQYVAPVTLNSYYFGNTKLNS